jgi:hypothetical protein
VDFAGAKTEAKAKDKAQAAGSAVAKRNFFKAISKTKVADFGHTVKSITHLNDT